MMPVKQLSSFLKITKELCATPAFQTVRDFVGSSDLTDDYRFRLTGRSSVSLSLQDLSANSDLQLIHDRNNNSQIDAGELITNSTKGGKNIESIHAILDAGNYYIRVYAASHCQNTTYGLSFNAVRTDHATTEVNEISKQQNPTPPISIPPVLTPPISTPPISAPPVLTPPISTPPVLTPPISAPPIPAPPISTPPISAPPVLTPPVKSGPENLFALSSSQQQAQLGINLNSTNYQAGGNTFVRANNDTPFWCTEYAYGRAIEKGLFADGQGIGASIWGDAGSWDDHIGLDNVKSQARTNSFIIWNPNQAGAGSLGHVGFVEEVYADGSFLISEANWNGLDFNLRLVNPASPAFTQAEFIYL
jgi:surface antigen